MELRAGYKATVLGVIPEQWTIKSLSDIGESLIGLTYKPENVKPEGWLVLRSSNVSDGRLRFDDNVFVDIEIPAKLVLAKGDILICVRNGSRDLIGKCALVDERVERLTFGAFMAVFRTPHYGFVYRQLESGLIKRQIAEHLGATINQITNKSLNSFSIPFPEDEAERRAIDGALADVDALLAALEKLIARKRDLKQAAMPQLLSGLVRLPGFDRPWEARALGQVIEALEAGVSVNSSDEELDTAPGGACILKTSSVSHGMFLAGERKRIHAKDLSRARVSPLRGRILISRMNTPDLIGECGYVERDYPNLFLPDRLWMTRFRSGHPLCPRWLAYRLSGLDCKRRLKSAATGTSGSMKNLSKNGLLSIELPFPDQSEQAAIAEVLSDMDAEIAALEARLAKTRALKQGMMQELLTGRIRLV